jgi:hypothetical protein
MAGSILVVNMGGTATKKVRLRRLVDDRPTYDTLVRDPSPISAGDAREYRDCGPGMWDVTLVDERLDVHGPVLVEVTDAARVDARVP